MLTQVPAVVHVVAVGAKYFAEEAVGDQLGVMRCFLTPEAAAAYKINVEPFPDSVVTVREVMFSVLYRDIKESELVMLLILSQCGATGDPEDLDVLLDPKATIH